VEDQDYPKHKEAKSLASRRFEKFSKELSSLNNRLGKIIDLELEITKSEKVKLTSKNQAFEMAPEQLACFTSWSNPIFDRYQTILDKNLDHLDKSRKSYSQFRKKFLGHLKGIDRLDKKNSLLRRYFEEDQVRELYNVIHNLQSLPSFLLTLQVFKSYTVCQILAHEKGQAFANSNFSSAGNKSTSKRFNVEEFNKAFQSIKKSKSKVFTNQSLNNPQVEAIGSFLAKSFSGSRYNIILILGRNDFLPPSVEELKVFNEVTLHLDPVLNAILRRSSQDDKISNLIDVLENINFPISIKNRSDSFLFKNETFETFKESGLKDFQYLERELFGKNILRFYFNREAREDTDLYHFYRVSLLGELLNTLRHELSNPLFGLSLAADIFNNESLDLEIQETIQDIKTNSDRCQTIIKNFSNLYQEEDNFKEFDLINLLKETIILTKSETKGIRKLIESDEDPLILYSNPTWISQIIFNLIINAAQALTDHFTPEKMRNGLISIMVKKENGNITISVSDNGAGIPDQLKDRLFEAFITTKDAGTGLGLAICKSLLKKLDGEIYFKDNIDAGTTFTISLPLE
jgi:two-component system NtrC family sensor kinase